MNEDELIEQTKFAIGRYDHYYETVNTKGNLYLALNALLIGGIATSYPLMEAKHLTSSIPNWALVGVIVLCAASMIWTVLAIHPFTKPGKQPINESLLFFGQVATMDCLHFTNKFRTRPKSVHIEDLLDQMHVLAAGLSMKFSMLKWAGRILALALIDLVLFTLFLIVTNTK